MNKNNVSSTVLWTIVGVVWVIIGAVHLRSPDCHKEGRLAFAFDTQNVEPAIKNQTLCLHQTEMKVDSITLNSVYTVPTIGGSCRVGDVHVPDYFLNREEGGQQHNDVFENVVCMCRNEVTPCSKLSKESVNVGSVLYIVIGLVIILIFWMIALYDCEKSPSSNSAC